MLVQVKKKRKWSESQHMKKYMKSLIQYSTVVKVVIIIAAATAAVVAVVLIQ